MRVRVATLNTWALPEPFAEDTDERIVMIGARLQDLDVDVIAFQEVFSRSARKTLVRAGKKAGLIYRHNRASIFGSGLLTLSRFPIESVHFEQFGHRGNPIHIESGEFFSGKGLAHLRLQTEAGPLSLINTHLHARYSQSYRHEYMGHRIGQMLQVIESARGSEDPLIALGDFNFEDSHPEHSILSGLTGLRDAAADLERREATVYAANPYRLDRRNPDKRIDFSFYREGTDRTVTPISTERIFDEFLDLGTHTGSYSNHAGVLAEFEIRSGAGGGRLAQPDRDSLALASQYLADGRAEAVERQTGRRSLAGAGLGLAAVAAATGRKARITRRKMLGLSLNSAACMALLPGVGASLLSEVFVPEEIQAFDDAHRRLARLGRAEVSPDTVRIS